MMKPKKGTVFLHRNMADPYWKPSNNENENDRPCAIMRVTSTRLNRVYFAYIDSSAGKGKFSMTVENWNQHYDGTSQILK